jgi:hypothetical protein
MQTEPEAAGGSKKLYWAGWVLTALPSALLIFSGAMKLTQSEQVMEGFTHLGYDPKIAVGLGIVELACTIIYLIPQTAVLGAILLTGYLGGATATHLRIGEPNFVAPVIVGMVLWGGLYLRDSRIRALLPLRS